MAHTCRGTINLASAFIHIEDSTTIVISSGGNHTFHLKATSEVDRQKWVTALELAKADAARLLEPGKTHCQGLLWLGICCCQHFSQMKKVGAK